MADDYPAVWCRKELLLTGRGNVPEFKKNTKAIFHFRTLRLQPDLTLDKVDISQAVVDDSRTMGCGPFELLIGRTFAMSIWEEAVRGMRIGETTRFYCPFVAVQFYSRVSKALREHALKKAGKEVPHQHQCGFAAVKGTGHTDLDKLTADKCPLAFEIELLRVEQPGDYKLDSWAMSESEKSLAIPRLQEEGNALYKTGDYHGAAEKYFEALSYLEEKSLKEKPHDETWNELEERKVPLLLNYSQCKLLMEDYPEVIRHTTTVLDFDGENVKALYRRGKANAASWNVEEAKADFAEVVRLDPSLSRSVEKELLTLSRRVREKDEEERERLRGKLF